MIRIEPDRMHESFTNPLKDADRAANLTDQCQQSILLPRLDILLTHYFTVT